jgi:2-C-methyl-D-erythritol 4-phosphate cytidylyltransferase
VKVSVSVAAVVLAGGSGARIQEDVNKVYMPIGDRPMLEYALETMDRSPQVSQVTLVVRRQDQARAELLVNETLPAKLTNVVVGGDSRHLSEMAGLEALRTDIESGDIDLVAIHDGARPFVTLQLLDDLIESAISHDGAVPALGIPEPLYRASDRGAERVEPESLRRVQTPQVFRAKPLLAAYEASVEAGFEGVDTAETMERFSDLRVVIVPGDPRNIKITFVEDFYTAEEHALDWEKGAWKDSM